MVNGGRISPAGGRTGHTHGEIQIPAQVVVDALDAATTANEVRLALLTWFAANGVIPTP